MATILAPVVVDSLIVEAVSTELVYASWPRRILSSVIDAFAIGAIFLTFFGATLSGSLDQTTNRLSLTPGATRTFAVASIIIPVVYMTALHSWRGSTLGKMATRTVLVMEDGTKVTPQAAFVRSVTFLAIQFSSRFLIAPIFVNELRPVWSPRRQTWHDAVAKTVVVKIDTSPNLTE